jgi:hypothetical protein
MCTDGVSLIVMNDENIQQLMSNPILDVIHKQVVMTLYSLDASDGLEDYKRMLPLYLGMDWDVCQKILDTIEKAGLLSHTSDGIALTHRVERDTSSACGCG